MPAFTGARAPACSGAGPAAATRASCSAWARETASGEQSKLTVVTASARDAIAAPFHAAGVPNKAAAAQLCSGTPVGIAQFTRPSGVLQLTSPSSWPYGSVPVVRISLSSPALISGGAPSAWAKLASSPRSCPVHWGGPTCRKAAPRWRASSSLGR
jgi:hypothetical protein